MEQQGKNKIWVLINSPFFISVILGLATFSYSRWQDNRTRERNIQEKIKNLDLEISNRLVFFDYARKDDSYSTFDSVLLTLEKPSTMDFPSGVFPDFKDRSFRSLVSELNSLVPEDEKAELASVLDGAKLIGISYIHTVGQNKHKNNGEITLLGLDKLDDIIKLNEKLEKYFNLKRWNCPLTEYGKRSEEYK